MNEASSQFEHSVRALASGKRITQASDDAAGLAIGEQLRGQMRGVRQAKMNAENATSLTQVAEGSLNEQANILLRMRELGIQAASDTVSDKERGYLNQEFTQLTSEFDRIAKTTSFGSKKLLTGNGSTLEFQLGWQGDATNVVKVELDGNSTASEVGIEGAEISSKSDARSSLGTIDKGLEKISEVRAKYGAFQSRLESARNSLEVQYEGIAQAHSRITDVDVAEETANLIQAKLKVDAGVSVMSQALALPASANKLLAML
jgi:flagellin